MTGYEIMAQSWTTTIAVAALIFASTGWLMATLTAPALGSQKGTKLAYGSGFVIAVAVFAQLFYLVHASLANSLIVTGAWVLSFVLPQLMVFRPDSIASQPMKTLLDGRANVKVRPAEGAVTMNGADLRAARERLTAKLETDFGKRAQRMLVGQGSTAKGSCLAIRITVNDYEWKKQKLYGQSLETFSAQIPRSFEGIPVQLTIRPAK